MVQKRVHQLVQKRVQGRCMRGTDESKGEGVKEVGDRIRYNRRHNIGYMRWHKRG